MHDKRRKQRCRCMWTLIGPVIARKKEDDRGDCQERQTLTETHVMFADACCIVKPRSSILRFDSRSVYELGNSITLPRLDDRCSDTNLQ